jgi:predicted PurR-regulated permease PerM
MEKGIWGVINRFNDWVETLSRFKASLLVTTLLILLLSLAIGLVWLYAVILLKLFGVIGLFVGVIFLVLFGVIYSSWND